MAFAKMNSPLPLVITIDGPAASGKTSVSRELARRLGWPWVSTGAFYRGLAYLAQQRGADLASEEALVRLAADPQFKVVLTPAKTCVFVDGRDVTEEIGSEDVGQLASQLSGLPQVRLALLKGQRDCAHGVKGLVAEGRDCGTVVFPNAKVKFFLTANSMDRANRRAKEKGRDAKTLHAEQKKRDAQDAGRKAAPMLASTDSFTLDTTRMSFLEVVETVEKLVSERLQLDPNLDKPGGHLHKE